MKKLVKYTSRIVLGLMTVFWGFATYGAFFPDESYHHCESGQKDMSPMSCLLLTILFLVLFCFVWYKTRDKQEKDKHLR